MEDFSGHDQPLVSVMMPVYNGEKTIMFAIKSLLMQTYKNWLCIIVNDGSNDGTQKLLNKISDQRFKIIHLEKNLGRGAARQVALDNVEGKYITYLDADDIYHPDKLEIQVRFMENNDDIELVACGIGSFDQNNILRRVRGKGHMEKIIFTKDRVKFGFSPASSIIKINSAKKHRYRINLNVAEDVDYFSRLLYEKKIIILNKVLYYYFEFGNTSARKIISYYLHGMKSDYYLIQNKGFHGFTQLIKSLIKFSIYLITLPIFGSEFYLKKRGNVPTENEITEFNGVLAILNELPNVLF
jgi:glycosyltransferase involved in cell wall biosynthesis